MRSMKIDFLAEMLVGYFKEFFRPCAIIADLTFALGKDQILVKLCIQYASLGVFFSEGGNHSRMT